MGSRMPSSPKCAAQREIHLEANSVPASMSGMKSAAKVFCRPAVLVPMICSAGASIRPSSSCPAVMPGVRISSSTCG